jgi:hypothetical protein
VRRARTVASRLVIAYLALQVLSGLLILLAIAWCLIEIWRGPTRSRGRSRRTAPHLAADWYDLEVGGARLRTARCAVELDLAAA